MDSPHPRVRSDCSRFGRGRPLCTGKAEGEEKPLLSSEEHPVLPTSPLGADMGSWVSTSFISPH